MANLNITVAQDTVELRHEGALLGEGGIAFPYPSFSLAEVWVRLEPTGHEWPTSVGRQAKRALEKWVETYHPQRVQAHIVAKNEPARRLVEWLGFTCECETPLFGPDGEDCIQYVMFPQKEKDKSNG